jgi:hypothetical protein
MEHTQSPNDQSGFFGIDLNAYCQSLGHTGATLDGSTMYNWVCVDQSGNQVGFDLTYACQWSMNSQWGEDRIGNFYDPSSLKCFSGSKAGGLDLNAYCQSLGHTGATLDGKTVYDWRCVDQNGNHVSFSPTAACEWTFGSWAFDRFGNFEDPSSIQCWGFGHPV